MDKRSLTQPLVCLAILFMSLLGCHPRNRPQDPLQTIGQIRSLSPARLREAPPVSIQGIVTFCDERSRLLVVQDSTGGISVESRAAFNGMRVGDRVGVQGYCGYEAYSPVIVKPQLRRMEPGPLPQAVTGDIQKLMAGQLDFQRVEVECEVTERAVSGGRFELKVDAGGHFFTALGRFVLPQALYYNCVGRRLRLKGVPVMARQPSGEGFALRLYVASAEDVQDLSGAAKVRTSPAIADVQPSGPLRRFTDLHSVKSLSNYEAKQGHSVCFRGIVTYYDAGADQLWVQDSTAGTFIQPPQEPIPGLRSGVQVEIEGITAEGGFAPQIQPSHIRILGKAPWPKPIEVHPELGFPVWEENRWARIRGVITRISYDPIYDLLQMDLQSGTTRFLIDCYTPPSDLSQFEAFLDHLVEVQGVYSPVFSSDMRLVGFGLKLPHQGLVNVLPESTGDTFEAKPRPIHGLMEYHPTGTPRHRVKVMGQVSYVGNDGKIYVQDESGGVGLEGISPRDIRVGDFVEALGFMDPTRTRVALRNAQLRRGHAGATIRPTPIAADTAMTGIHDSCLVTVEGFLREQTPSFGDRILSLESGRTTFTAILEHPQAFEGLDRLQTGALLRLTGVCEIGWDEGLHPPMPAGLVLRMRTPADIVVLKNGPFWTLQRALALMTLLLAGLAAATGCLVFLQKRVRARTQQLKRQMTERESLEDQLRQAQKLEGVGRLAGGVAHDFNNLLTVINGYCEMLVVELAGQEELQTCAREIHKAGERAAALTRQLLAFSRKQILQPVVLDLNLLVAEMDNLLRRLLNEDIQLVLRTSPRPCQMKADPGQISQVLMNLVVNARDAMPGGGKLIIETEAVHLDEEMTRGHADIAPGPYIRMTVSDTGVGMDASTREKIFEPFFTTKEQGKGTGLGLSTVFGIVKQSGGHIWVYSEPGQGTSFKLFFPQVEGEGFIEEDRFEKTLGGGETILVVEDQPEVLKLVCRALEGQGYMILTAPDGAQALRVASAFQGRIHLLLTDVVMPGMNGRDLARRLEASRSGLRVIFMSGYTEDVVVHKGVLEKGIDFIQKPFSPRELATKVIEVLGRK